MGRQSGQTSEDLSFRATALVFAGCYLGASADVWIRFPEIGAAIVFLPYAIVTAALWRTPPRTWWIFILAAAAGDFHPHRLGGATVTFALLAEGVNAARAVVAALALRRFVGRAGHLETLREMVAYLLGAVLLGPAIGALGGAWLIAAAHPGRSFWLASLQWFSSNAITALTVLPLLADLPRLRVRLRNLSEHAKMEAGVLALLLLAAGAGVFARSYDHSHTHQAHLYWALPFLLWAIRFGPRGISATLLAVTAMSVWGAIAGRGPFAVHAPVANLLELEVFLLAVSFPLLLLAALFAQQRGTAAALIESRRQYRSVVEDQTEMICRFRPDGTYTFANRAYCETLWMESRDVLGNNVWSLTPEGVHRTPAELQVITPSSPIATREVMVSAQGSYPRWQQWRDRGLFDDNGTVVEYQSVGRDITDRKKAEDERRELEARRSVEAALRDADRRKDEFLAMLGHELRNPLAPIGIALEILRHAPPGGQDAVWARESIGRQLGQMTRLLDDLLDISRITLGKIQLQLGAVDLGQVIANAVEAARPCLDSLGHALTVRLPEHPVVIRGDAARLTQVVANLLNNAAKYTERGGRVDVAVALAASESRVEVRVRDSGIGLDPDALERVFELYSQIPAGRERSQGGLGIGLALVRRLVELHDGSVSAHSKGTNRGSEFIVDLPATPPDLPERARRPAGPPVRPALRPALRILAVDDNVDVAEGLASVLGMWGHTVRIAHDGAAALEAAVDFSPEVVFVDLGLPRIDGLEVARRLRQASVRQQPALLVSMSGFGQEQTRRKSGEAGFHHHLVKPVDMDSLRALLDTCARERSQRAG
ncbi:MAG TPA: ATP-binding protein [Polyangia bacterium]